MDIKSTLLEMKANTEKTLEEVKRGSYSKAYFEGYLQAIDDALELTKPIKENTEASDE